MQHVEGPKPQDILQPLRERLHAVYHIVMGPRSAECRAQLQPQAKMRTMSWLVARIVHCGK